ISEETKEDVAEEEDSQPTSDVNDNAESNANEVWNILCSISKRKKEGGHETKKGGEKIIKRRRQLEEGLKAQQDIETLQKEGIYKTFMQESKENLEKSQLKDTMKHELNARPTSSELEDAADKSLCQFIIIYLFILFFFAVVVIKKMIVNGF
ncbi:hypothetical protein RFI_10414, partial [Reticulomyxa filosa]